MVCFVHFDLEMCFAPQRRALFRKSTSEPPKVVRTWCVLHILTSKRASRHNGGHFFESRHLSLPKVVRTWCVLYILTWKCASRHNGVHFFDIATSKSGPNLVCFVHFDLEMCFAPQRRALFRHLNFQKWSEPGVFCTFSLGNVLRATMASTFSTSQLPKVVRPCGVLCIFTWKCASRHNGVQFFISHLASCLRTRRFSEPTFRPSGATNHWKNTVNRDFPTFSRICIFFLLIFSLLIFSLLIFSLLTLLTSAFQLSILSEVSLLNFLRWSLGTLVCRTLNSNIFRLFLVQALNELARSKLPQVVLETLHEMQSLQMEINALLNSKVRRRWKMQFTSPHQISWYYLRIHQRVWFANRQFQNAGPSLKPARDCQGLGWFLRMMRGFTSRPLSKLVIGSLPCISWTLRCGGESHPMLFASLRHTIEWCWMDANFAYGISQYLVLWCSNKDGDNMDIIPFKIHD